MITEDVRLIIGDILTVLFLGSAFLVIVCELIVAFTLARRVRKQLDQKEMKTGESYVRLSWPLWTGSVMVGCVLRKRPQHPRWYPYYRGFDVHGFANRFERVVCYIGVYCTIIALLAVVLVYAADYFLDLGLLDQE